MFVASRTTKIVVVAQKNASLSPNLYDHTCRKDDDYPRRATGIKIYFTSGGANVNRRTSQTRARRARNRALPVIELGQRVEVDCDVREKGDCGGTGLTERKGLRRVL